MASKGWTPPPAKPISATLSAALKRRGFERAVTPVDLATARLPPPDYRSGLPSGVDLEAQESDRNNFLEAMATSHSKADKLKQQLNNAARVSRETKTRRSSVLPKDVGSCIRESVDSARAMSRFSAMALASPGRDGGPPMCREAPPLLGHLVVPEPTPLMDPRPRPAQQRPDAARCSERGREESGLGECSVPAGAGFDLDAGSPFSPLPCINSAIGPSPIPEESKAMCSPLSGESSACGDVSGLSSRSPQLGPRELQLSGPTDVHELHLPPEGGFNDDQFGADCSDIESSSYEDLSEDNEWPPKPPAQRFKTMVKFSNNFKKKQELELVPDPKSEKNSLTKISNPAVVWVNAFFKMDLETETQLNNTFPVIMLFMLDPVYPNKVPWRLVDWNLHFKCSLLRNYRVLGNLWSAANMEKARGFRVEDTQLRFENIAFGTLQDRLEFLRLTIRWFETRVKNHSTPYDAIERRKQIVHMCKKRGFAVRYPTWIQFSVDDYRDAAKLDEKVPDSEAAYNSMPEFKRLIYFLGSTEHQNM